MPSAVRAIHEAGQRALLLELKSLEDVMALHQQLTIEPLPGQVDSVAAARTLLLQFSARGHLAEARRQLRRIRIPAFRAAESRTVEIDVVYDGEDLQEAAEHLGLSSEAVAQWHCGQEWTGAFGGFAPGFTYCVRRAGRGRGRRGRRAEEELSIPRRDEPRTAVPAGAVGLAGEFSAVYPRSSPGGWQLIGRADAVLWDPERESPALIRPGDAVRYRAVREQLSLSEPPVQEAATSQPARQDVVLEVLHAGPQVLTEDLGRPGYGGMGVSVSGAADRASARQANQLAGNDDAATVLEVLWGTLELRARQTAVLAITGADTEITVLTPDPEEGSNSAASHSGTGRYGRPAWHCPAPGSAADTGGTAPGTAPSNRNGLKRPERSERNVPMRAPFWLFPGETVRLGAPRAGVRSYVAVSGGFAAVEHLGSASVDTLSGLGPAPVRAGDGLALAGAASRFVGIASVARTPLPESEEPVRLRFVPGPRDEWFGNPGLRRLTGQVWTVSQEADRIGMRLTDPDLPLGPEGPPAHPGPLERVREGELPSEGMVRGSLQVPPSGLPVLFLADHPVTGGYPVIGVVVREDLPLAAQLPPGTRVRFTAVEPESLAPR